MLHSIPARYRSFSLFVLSYVVLYLVYAWFDFLPKWDAYGTAFLHGQHAAGYLFVDPLFLGIPIVGFALMWIAIRWALHAFEGEQILTIPFALGFVIIAYFAYFVGLVMYYWNNAFLSFSLQGEASPGLSSLVFTLDFVVKNFLDQLLGSPFFLLVLSALAGWVAFVLIHRRAHAPAHSLA